MKSVMTLTLVTMLAGSNAFASAPQLDELPTRVVKYGDLDLNRNEGAAVLYKRIRTAAQQVCEPLAQVASPSLIEVNRCISKAIDRAVGDVDAPLLSDFHRAVITDRQR